MTRKIWRTTLIRRVAALLAVAPALFCPRLFAQGGQEPGKGLDAMSLEDLMELKVNVGTRGETRSAFDALIPVEVLTGSELRETGMPDLGSALQRLLPYVNYPCPMIMDVTDHTPPLGFRGLSPDQVLVLVNGKRRHPSALVNNNSRVGKGCQHTDLNTLPLEAVERVEILRDGAAAQYGSDAIAGIVNVVLKQHEPSSVAVTGGTTAEADGSRGGVASHLHFHVPNDGFFNITAEYRERGVLNRAEADTRPQYFDGDPRNGFPPRVSQRYGEAAQTNLSLVLNGLFPVNGITSFYTFGTFNNRTGESPGYFRAARDDRNVRAIHPDGFLPLITPTIRDASFLAGFRTEVAGWEADFSTVIGGSSIAVGVKDSVNTSMGTSSPTAFDCGRLLFNQWTSNADLFRTVSVGLKSPLEVGVGVEYRRETYRIFAGETSSWLDGRVPILDGPSAGQPATPGAQVFPGFTPSDETRSTRHSLAAYLDIEHQLLRTVRVQFAGRFEWADDYGSMFTWKHAGRWEAHPNFALRYSCGTGFRAPSLAQAHFQSTATNYMDGQPYQNGTFPVNHPLSMLLGATPLKPEHSLHVSVGAVVKLRRKFSLSIDGYYSRVNDRVVLSGSYTRANAPLLAPLLEAYRVGGVQFFTNAVDMRNRGLDASMRYSTEIPGVGSFLFTGSLNVNQVKILDIHPPPAVAPYPEIFFSRAERARIETYHPEIGARAAVRYQRGPVEAILRMMYGGDITIVNSASRPQLDQELSGGVVLDAQFSWKPFKGWELSVGSHNFLDAYPDRLDPVEGDPYTGAILPYHPFSPFGISGAEFYVRIRYQH